jgi:hypothetical protein
VPDRLNALDKVLNAGEATERVHQADEERDTAEQEVWEARFAELVATVVLPVFEPYAQYLNQRGYPTKIESGKERVELVISRNHVEASLSVLLHQTTVWLDAAAGAEHTKPSEFAVDELTHEKLEDTLFDLIKKRYGG